MAIDPVKIPQNVNVEDRVIGPITLRHIFMFLAGGGMSYVVWSILKAAGLVTIFHIVISLIPLGIMILFAIVRINEISLFRFILIMIEQTQKPSKRTWQPRKGIDVTMRGGMNKPEKNINQNHEQKTKQTNTFDELSAVLDNDSVLGKKNNNDSDKS